MNNQLAQGWPEPVAFNTRKPKVEDADGSGIILMGRKSEKRPWIMKAWNADPGGYTHWLPCPPPILSPQEMAFIAWFNTQTEPVTQTELESLRIAFDGGAYWERSKSYAVLAPPPPPPLPPFPGRVLPPLPDLDAIRSSGLAPTSAEVKQAKALIKSFEGKVGRRPVSYYQAKDIIERANGGRG